jgi:hypothetical protein
MAKGYSGWPHVEGKQMRGIHNWQNYCEIFVVYTQFTDVPMRWKIELGGPRVGDPWLRYALINRSVTAILLSAVNCSSVRNGAIPFKVQEEDWDSRRVFLAQCNFGVTFDRYGRSQKERRRDGRKQKITKQPTCLQPTTRINQKFTTDTQLICH